MIIVNKHLSDNPTIVRKRVYFKVRKPGGNTFVVNRKKFTDSLKNIPSQIKSKIKVDIDISTTHANATIKGITIHGGGGGTFAQGGFPERGDLFIANEQGAEMVGSFGGKPAVANNTQIIEGVASGVAKANQEELVLLREQNELLRKMLAKPTSVKIGER
jgi:hypothetical protein